MTTNAKAVPDQPDGIDEQSTDLPDPTRAAKRIDEYVRESGDGLYDVQGGAPLYGRDLEAVRRAVTESLTQIDECDATISTLRADLDFQTKAAFANQAEANGLRALLERLTQAADQFALGRSGEPLTGEALEGARRDLIEVVTDAWMVLRPAGAEAVART